MTPAEIQALALAHREAAQVTLWGRLDVYKVRGKVFGICRAGEGLSFKATEIAYEVLTEEGRGHPAPGFPVRRGGWVEVGLDDLTAEEAAGWLATSYRLVAATMTKKAQGELGL